MKVLLAAHPNIIDTQAERAWLRSFRDSAPGAAEITLFCPHRHKIADFDLVHAIGLPFAELLWNLKASGKKAVLTPALHALAARPPALGLLELLLRSFRSLSQGRVPPHDYFFCLRNLDGYLLLPQQEAWARSCGLPRGRTCGLPGDPRQAAAHAAPFYESLWKSA